MKTYSPADLAQALRRVGIPRGGIVLVHSALFSLGAMEGVPPAQVPAQVYRAFREVIGDEGTLCVPAAFDDYARFALPYDCRRSPVDRGQGAFSEYVRSLPGTVRTYCPMMAVAANGPLAEDICHQYTGSAFGVDSAWDRLYEHDAGICFLGVRPAYAFTFTGYIQARYGVPHLYSKLYTTPVYEDGNPVNLPITCHVRYRNPAFKIAENCVPFEEHLKACGITRMEGVGRGAVYFMPSARAVFREGVECLKKNLFYFCKQVPEFIPGEVPMDGATGKFVPDELRLRSAAPQEG
ncbi:MAG: AAC(3) family N-acetyltransferase [Chthonomonadales bacterium]